MSHDTLTPPPVAAPDAPAPRSGSSAPGVLSILLVVFGVIVIAATVLNGVLGTFDGAARQEQTQTAAVDGVTRLEVDASRTDLTVVFDDVDVATLDTVDTGRADWTLERDGDRLRVASPHRSWFSWVGFGDAGRATLTLPQHLSGIDATMSLAGGSLQATGSFGELTLDLAAGALTVTGDARTLDTTVSAGSADLSLTDVREATVSLAAGELVGRLTGSAPERTAITVSAGSLELSLPDVAYAVRSDVSAGSLDDSRLRTASASPRTISVEVSAGSATLLGRG